jgi:Ca2+-binding EF-hand superfamily protein
LDFQQEKIVPNRYIIILAASVAAVAIGPAANAQASTPPKAPAAQARPAAPAARTLKPIVRADILRELNANYKAIDVNGDGALVQSELEAVQARVQQNANAQFAKRREGVFRQLDTNKDGQLSQADFNAGSPPPRLRDPAPAAFMQQMDSNKDQKLSPAEFGATTLANFDRLDLNRDGIVSVEERQKARTARK